MNFGSQDPGADPSPAPGGVGVLAGLVPTSLVDFPGRVAATLFLGGCNFRCPFCQNPQLVVGPWHELMPLPELTSWLAERHKLLEGVCISGGEPCLDVEVLARIASLAHAQDLAVKVDTNGSKPEAISRLIAANLVDYVALDIKASPQRYSTATGVPTDLDAIAETVRILREAHLPQELRTTIVPRLHAPEDLRAIGEWVGGDSPYYVQPFRPGTTLDPAWATEPEPSRELLEELARVVEPYFAGVAVRA